ncbi:MAG: vitamin K epoxide reductase family protein [Candidatus Aminicenantes bacterium]|nr:vitamin K epoxide reductase family protein [Candidatus Aminicenantes bacterium]
MVYHTQMNKTEKKPLKVIWLVLAGFCVLFLATIILYWIKGDNYRLSIILLMFKIIGLGTSILLVLGELGHPIFKKICIKGEKIDCYAVMESPAAKVLGLIPMADLGVLYFSGGIILIAFSGVNSQFFKQIFLLALLNLMTLPYTLFSVGYQALAVKKWCELCLIVQLTFWLEFLQFYKFLSAGFPGFTIEDFFPFTWSFGLPLLVWLVFRPALQKSIRFDKR